MVLNFFCFIIKKRNTMYNLFTGILLSSTIGLHLSKLSVLNRYNLPTNFETIFPYSVLLCGMILSIINKDITRLLMFLTSFRVSLVDQLSNWHLCINLRVFQRWMLVFTGISMVLCFAVLIICVVNLRYAQRENTDTYSQFTNPMQVIAPDENPYDCPSISTTRNTPMDHELACPISDKSQQHPKNLINLANDNPKQTSLKT